MSREVREPLTLPDRPFGRLAPTAAVSLISVESLFIKVSSVEVDQVFLSLFEVVRLWPALLF